MKKTLALTILALALICGGTASAQTTSFTYQGNLNTSGTPANGNHDFEFALFDALAAGTQLGSTLTRTNVAVADGIFAVTLDFGTQFPGANRFLEIRVRTSGGGAFTPLAPRQQVTSSPYSINAAQLGGVAASAYVTTTGGVINAGTQYNIGGIRILSTTGNSVSLGPNSGNVNTGIANTFLGNGTGFSNTSGSVNTFVGAGSGQNNTTGFNNSFLGTGAGQNTTTGSQNSFFGAQAGVLNTEGARNSFFGNGSGFSNTIGVDNAYFGHLAGRETTTSKNAFFGSQAGAKNTTGDANAFFGALTGNNNTVGSDNSFFGIEAGFTNTSGFDNAFFGRFTGFRNTTGNQNSFFGNSAGIDITTGSGNSFFGLAAGSDVITGSRNSYFGYGTGNGQADGTFTSAFGAHATTSDALTNATAIGARAMATQSNSLVLGAINGVNNAPADTNVGIGTTAPTQRLHVVGNGLFSANLTAATVNATTQFNFNGTRILAAPGSSNLFVGPDAGLSNTTGTINAFFGSGSGHDNLSGSENSFFGVNTGRGNTSGNRNTYFGRLAGRFNTTGSDNTSIGYNAASGNLTGSGNTLVGANADVGSGALVNATAIGSQALVTTNNSLVLGAINGINGATVNTRVGIGTTAPINRLTVGDPEAPLLGSLVGLFNAGGTFMTVRDTSNNIEGFVGADGNGVLFGSMSDSIVRIRTNNTNRLTFDTGGAAIFSGNAVVEGFIVPTLLDNNGVTPICRNASERLSFCSSSLRYKSNVATFSTGLDLIRRLRPVSFTWKEGGMNDLGLVAEEVAAAEPLLTTTNAKGEVEGVKYDRVGVILVNAVKEQQAEIEAQKKEINDLRSQVELLKRLFCAGNPTGEICKE
jgi:hypothetical protein